VGINWLNKAGKQHIIAEKNHNYKLALNNLAILTLFYISVFFK